MAASLHVAAAISNLIAMEYQPVMLEIMNRFLKQPIICERGVFQMPAGPGLGIEINEYALSTYAKEYT
jgi:D-galactarolactone cycloisomerase